MGWVIKYLSIIPSIIRNRLSHRLVSLVELRTHAHILRDSFFVPTVENLKNPKNPRTSQRFAVAKKGVMKPQICPFGGHKFLLTPSPSALRTAKRGEALHVLWKAGERDSVFFLDPANYQKTSCASLLIVKETLCFEGGAGLQKESEALMLIVLLTVFRAAILIFEGEGLQELR